MVKIEEMNKEQVEDLLNARCDLAIEMGDFYDLCPGVFCGIRLDYENTLHIHETEDFKKIARILEKEFVVIPYEDKGNFDYLGLLAFNYEYAGKNWRAFTLYRDESEVVG